ncbi:hypothetical protein RRU01S_13_00140 [Agrobacterium rubi TR3 = NBRC 13261]|uniref:Uncharacterized protein n=1 Tax=Agrobacterium rubi TR3 = NBRC 13261 TaxID=1368415 RepID=A0A081CVI0_9HYPH|nr:hypothetical protein [Agrobacterium rubi]MBP1877638.1 hypothetical protein [Agrobacterium rubi]GAK70676.1 hypothetical protein RRU01S_13_00140 [Agrobacterium rubi TR3 = NBRC 13261]
MSDRNRNSLEKLIYAVSWVDDDGTPVDSVPDRFQSLYLIRSDYTGVEQINSWPLSRKGFSSLTIRDAVTLGFSTIEYLALIKYEEEFYQTVQSEEELDALIETSPSQSPR